MKKILSILLTVTMVFTFVASFRAPTASAAAGTYDVGSIVVASDKDVGLSATPMKTFWSTAGYGYASGTDFIVSVGDIRLTPVGPYLQGSVVKPGDSDMGVDLDPRRVSTPEWPAVSIGKVYLNTVLTPPPDVDVSEIRLTPVPPYPAYSLVAVGDFDVGALYIGYDFWVSVTEDDPISSGKPGVYFWATNDNVPGNNPTEVIPGMIRLTPVKYTYTEPGPVTDLKITTTSFSGCASSPFTKFLTVTGGVAPYTWSIVSPPDLLQGLSLNSTTGEISGILPSCSGIYAFTFEVTDSALHTATKTISITVTGGISLTDTKSYLDWYEGAPAWTPITAGVPQSTYPVKVPVYKMGDIIHGVIVDCDGKTVVPVSQWRVELQDVNGVVIDTVNMAPGSAYFTIGTSNIRYDGVYKLEAYLAGEIEPFACYYPIYIQYNLIVASGSLTRCGTQTVSGWVVRGNSQTVTVPVDVYITYPDNTLAAQYTIPAGSSGQFALTFPVLDRAGDFNIFIRDGYAEQFGYTDGTLLPNPPTAANLSPENDAMIYKTLSNAPELALNLSTYISPVRIYKNQTGQPVLLHLVDQDGIPVSGATWTVTGATSYTYSEISAGFYRFVINVAGSVDVRFKAKYTLYGTPTYSNEVIINTVDLGVFNPYVDITTPDSCVGNGDLKLGWPLDEIQTVCDKLPCTIGNSFNIKVDSWPIPTSMTADWSVYDASWEINGPVEDITGACSYALGDSMKVLVTQKGKISVTINMTAWERVDKTCDISAYNACCHEYTKTFDICEVNSCTYGGVTLTGANITNSTTVEVGKKIDKFSVSIDPTGAPADLTCSCPNYVVLMYMTDADGVLLEDAFTVDTWTGIAASGSVILYNPQGVPIFNFVKTGIYDEDRVLVSEALKFGDCPFNLYGITFNYPTGTSCDYHLVLKVFGLDRRFDACGTPTVTYPMIAEDLAPITVTPSVTTLTATHTIIEGTVDPDQMLAGVPAIIDITDPHFSVDGGDTDWNAVSWKYYFNGTLLDGYSYCHTWVEYGMTVTPSKTDTGYRFVLSIPFTTSGTFKIVGTSYYYDCTKKEVVTIEIEVLAPEFTVKIGLKDCDKTIIDNDGILTEGFDEVIYVTAVDPRGIHDFSTDPNWTLSVSARKNACGLYTSKACGVVEGPGCSYGLPIRVVGYDNPNLEDDPKVRLYFKAFGTSIKVTDFTLVAPTVKVDPAEVPFTIPATATHVTFTVADAHGHGASGVDVIVLNTPSFGVGASGYSWSATAGTTGCKGEVDWAFVPPYSGKYTVKATATTLITCELPCGWTGINTTATLQAVYQAPVVDTEKPVVTITAPAGGSTVNTPTVKITGTATDNVGVVSVFVGTKMADFNSSTGEFSAVVDLVVGDNTFTVTASDAALTPNVGKATVTVTYEVKKVTVVKLTIGQDIMTVNGQAVQLDAAPEIVNGRTFLPLRAIAEIFGATVEWIPDPDIMGVIVTLGDHTIGLQIGNPTAVINGNVVDIVAPYIKNGRTMVPLRVIGEGLGATVEWDPVYRIVTITM